MKDTHDILYLACAHLPVYRVQCRICGYDSSWMMIHSMKTEGNPDDRINHNCGCFYSRDGNNRTQRSITSLCSLDYKTGQCCTNLTVWAHSRYEDTTSPSRPPSCSVHSCTDLHLLWATLASTQVLIKWTRVLCPSKTCFGFALVK